MGEVLRRWPELRADMDATVEARADFVALRDRVANDDLPRFETEFKEQLNKNAIQELAGFNNWLNRQASAIDERVDRINEALGAVPYNPGRYIRLEKEPTTNQEVAQFRSDLRNADQRQPRRRRRPVLRAALPRRQADHRAVAGPRRLLRVRQGLDPRVTDVRNWFVFSASERDRETDEEWEHYSDSDGKSGGQKEKLAYTILAASLAYQFGLEWGAVKSKDFRFAVIDEAFGRGSDVSTRYALELFAKLGLQLLIVTPLQKVHVIDPYVKAIGFVDNPDRHVLPAPDDDHRGVPREAGRGAAVSHPWTTPDDIAAKVRRRWDDGTLLRAYATAADFETIEIPVRAPKRERDRRGPRCGPRLDRSP